MILNCHLLSLRRVAIELAASAMFLLCAVNAHAQASRVGATLEGIVSDTTGAVIPSTKVSLHNPLTNQSRSVSTDGQGLFRAEQLAVGTYEVGVEQTGFAPYRHPGVVLSLGQTVHLDIVLSPASASEKVTVSAQPSAIDTSAFQRPKCRSPLWEKVSFVSVRPYTPPFNTTVRWCCIDLLNAPRLPDKWFSHALHTACLPDSCETIPG